MEVGQVKDFVAVVGIDGLFDAAHIDAGEPANGDGKGTVAARVIDGPVGTAVEPVAAAATEAAAGGIHQAAQDELGRVAVVRRKRGFAVAAFHGDVLAERALRPQSRKEQGEHGKHKSNSVTCGHRAVRLIGV